MACFYCQHNDGINNPDNGDCVECKFHVCVDPPVRSDKKFHATLCLCHCRQLVCRYDAARHAATHHQSATDCFPPVAIAAASALMRAAIAESHEGRVGGGLDRDAIDTFNDFLNFTAPGYDELRAAFQRSTETRASDVADETAIADVHGFLRFRPDFFASGTIDKLVALAGDTLVRAWARADAETQGSARLWLAEPLARELNASFLSSDEPRYSEDFLGAFKVGRILRVPPSIARALRDTTPPTSASDLADWFVSSRELTTARAR